MNISERQRILRENKARQESLRWEINVRGECEKRLHVLFRESCFGRLPTMEEFEQWLHTPDGQTAIQRVIADVNADSTLNFRFIVPKSVASRWPTKTTWRGEEV